MHTLNYGLCGIGASVTFIQNAILGYISGSYTMDQTPGYLQCSSHASGLVGERGWVDGWTGLGGHGIVADSIG